MNRKLLEFEDDGEKWIVWDRNESVQVELYKFHLSEQPVLVELMPKKMIKKLSEVLGDE